MRENTVVRTSGTSQVSDTLPRTKWGLSPRSISLSSFSLPPSTYKLVFALVSDNEN